MGDFVVIQEDNFNVEVLDSILPVILEFGGASCRPCKTLETLLLKLGQEWAGKVRLAQVEVENAPDLALRYNVMCLPTLVLIKGGQVYATLTGLQPLERIRKTFLPFIEV
jgi:thioredoxin 1